jgi:glycosyltransferase involved in cell wall biosynthesis
MGAPERSVLHVLPHPGGGGDAYVDLLGAMPGHRFDRAYLGSSPRPPSREVARGLVGIMRRSRRYDLVHVHGEVAAGLCLPLLATGPSVVTLHGLHLVRRLHGVRRRTAVLNLHAVLRAADRTICVSQTEHDQLTSVVGPTAARRAVVIHNGARLPPAGIEADRAVVRTELGIPEEEVVGIWVGSLDERKDPLTAVRAAALAQVALLVVGDGPLRPEVEQKAAGSIRVLGERRDVPRLLSACDLFIVTSRREGLALALLEAMAHGLPAVVSDLPENVEAVGDVGIGVRLGDDAALAAALRRLAENRGERIALGMGARRRIAERFDVRQMIEKTRAVYGSLHAADLG